MRNLGKERTDMRKAGKGREMMNSKNNFYSDLKSCTVMIYIANY